MKEIIRFIKKLFGVYESDYEYWVYSKEIKINPEWKKNQNWKNKV